MRLAVVGATGGSGLKIMEHALLRGHSVVALVRTPEKITFKHENLKVEKADVYNTEELVPHMQGCSSLISCLGVEPSITKVTLMQDTIKPLHEAMRQSSINRFLTITSWCTTYDKSHPKYMEWYWKPLFIGRLLKDMYTMEEYLKNTDLNYTVFRAGMLTNKPLDDKEIIAEEGQWVKTGSPYLSRNHLAKFMLDSLEKDSWDRKMVAIGMPKSAKNREVIETSGSLHS